MLKHKLTDFISAFYLVDITGFALFRKYIVCFILTAALFLIVFYKHNLNLICLIYICFNLIVFDLIEIYDFKEINHSKF